MKALAIAAKKCFENYRPGGMRVHAGSLILEPGLGQEDYQEVVSKVFGLRRLVLALLNQLLNIFLWF